jgi:hypothetical protein
MDTTNNNENSLKKAVLLAAALFSITLLFPCVSGKSG